MKWAVGLTSVEERRGNLLPRTIRSLAEAGWTEFRLFVDGCNDPQSWERDFQQEVTARYPKIRTSYNWILALQELYMRNPKAERFLMLQDDVIFVCNLREYLEYVPYPERAYLNLYTFPKNHPAEIRRHGMAAPPDTYRGFYPSNQLGKGAIALVFNRQAVIEVLQNREHIIRRCESTERGHKAIDGGVVDAMKIAGYKEYVHYPSLTQHIGQISTMGNGRHPLAPSFPGEGYHATDLIMKQLETGNQVA